MSRYTLLYRPPCTFTLPPKKWSIVERPSPMIDPSWWRRNDLPVSRHQFGVVEFEEPLTADEIAKWQLKAV